MVRAAFRNLAIFAKGGWGQPQTLHLIESIFLIKQQKNQNLISKSLHFEGGGEVDQGQLGKSLHLESF